MKISQKVGLAPIGTIYFSESLQFSLQENVMVIWGQVPPFEKMANTRVMHHIYWLDPIACKMPFL